jgi:glycosyltransferase involved in cell wall biosynthesis
VTTVHGFSGDAILPAYRHARSALVSISFADRAPGLQYAANVYHGVDADELPFSPAGGDALAFFGRIHPDKGTATAIEIAARAGRRLVICGIVQDQAYYRECVEPHVDGDRVTYLGPIGPHRRAEILGSSLALLHPIAFAEPFGLSVVEAMMCGTPTITFALGSMPEIVEHGATGFLAANVDDAVGMVDRVSTLERAHCRRVAEKRFSASRMVDDYIAVYRDVIG